jgi:hypothetical protein
MGVEARFQAIPEDCELLKYARHEYDIAEMMEFFNHYANKETRREFFPSQIAPFVEYVDALVSTNPTLPERYFYAGGRNWDKILYLLSPARRAGEYTNDQSLIYKALKGCERLHPDANATQGHPIGFVPARDVLLIATYLDSVTYDQLHEHYSPILMVEMSVYKMHETADDKNFPPIWEEFTGMRDIYRSTANHNEAMIVVID